MRTDSTATTDRPSNVRARLTNNPRKLAGVDGRTTRGRRRRDLIESYVGALGGWRAVTDAQLSDIRRAAELTAIAEQARAAALQDGAVTIDLGGLIKIEGAADRAVRRLGIKSAAPKQQTLEEYLASRQASPPVTAKAKARA
jgi:hypothetical protein